MKTEEGCKARGGGSFGSDNRTRGRWVRSYKERLRKIVENEFLKAIYLFLN